MAKDPVCGMEVDENKSGHKMNYKGKTYYFCGQSCLQSFKNNPAHFLR